MILVGRYLSPFVRRAAVAMKLLDFPFEQQALSTAEHMDEIRSFNPVGRVPALVLDDGEVLIDSGAIIDYLNEGQPAERALIPPGGAERRTVLKLTAIAHGAAEKGVASFYERTRRPQETVFQEWLDHLDHQVRGSLEALEAASEGREWLAGPRISLADVTAVCAYDFLKITSPHQFDSGSYANLAGLAARADAMPAFAETRPNA